ncbi:hypothetical protein A6E05_13645 [Aliivibrio sp. 1S165]|uniref:hypothetical protein n=1 Tax=unclassified Aliivibrio TaxID=2645654 RepID=UPI00080E49A3|nr:MULTISPECIES: hypothetical protein [unclassified Aliivibrio]OCH17758.1 hypothetical protein A6E05_13645 [Aliivibrio sp. 1S165]OCH33797.1 hypothetical protein A6E06_17770 [Aliivibrio sp. 1S175]
MEHRLDLLENAIDSLKEALEKYQDGERKGLSSYKFAILHFSHFFELLFKHYVTKSHPLLIYKNPFSRKIDKENTIGLWDAVQFLRNEGMEISKDFNNDLVWIKKLRNDIEHYKFELNAVEVNQTLGRLIRATNEFNDEHGIIDVTKYLGGRHLQIYNELGDEYTTKLYSSRIEAKDESDDGDGHYCDWCGESNVAAKKGDKLHCKLCEEITQLIECSICQESFSEEEVRVWNDDHPPHVDHICDYCYDKIMNM